MACRLSFPRLVYAEDNKAKFEQQKRNVTKYKELILERQSELRLQGSPAHEDPRLQELLPSRLPSIRRQRTLGPSRGVCKLSVLRPMRRYRTTGM